jgi:TonB-linked SusC/RagA family outer membrane protein
MTRDLTSESHHTLKQLLRIMKLSVFILTLFIFQAQASTSYAQKITLSEKNSSLISVLDKIAQQSGYDFVYGNTPVNAAKPITVVLKNEDITDALEKVFAGQQLSYAIRNKTVVLYQKEASFLDRVTGLFQTTTITGKVVDEQNVGLPGVTVQLKGSSTVTTTSSNGNYSISVPDKGAVLVFSYIGLISQEKAVSIGSVINVKMAASAETLEETVIVAYGTQRKKDLTGSVSTISGESLTDLPSTINLEQALQGRAAGVQVIQETGQPGGATKVRIRGASSLLGSNQPLYIVDGVPVVAEGNIPDNGNVVNTTLIREGLSSPLNNISPNDIESMTVLKDASATSIYGSRAANGVVIITTKKGSATKGPVYSFNTSVSYQEAQTQKVLNAAQFKELWTEAANNSTSTALIVQQMRNGTYFKDANTNWADELSPSDPLSRVANLSASGGNEKMRYYTSLGTTNHDGSFENSGFDRNNLLVNLDFQAGPSLKFGTSVNLSTSTQTSPDASLFSRIYTFRPDLPVYNPDGTFTFSDGMSSENPVALSKASNINKTNLLIGSVFGELNFAKYFLLRSMVSVNYNTGNLRTFYPSQTGRGGWARATGEGTGYGQQNSSQALSHLWENTLTYNQRLGNHSLEGIAGASWQGNQNEYMSASGMGFPQDDILNNLSSATSNFLISSSRNQSGLVSFFGRVNYGYADKYLFSLSARTDGSSKFAVENKWAFFPTVSGAWRLSEENFLKNVNFLDELKIRGSLGLTGQQNFGVYQWRTLFDADQYGGNPAVIQSQLGNNRLKWELTTQTDIGLDFSLFKGRLGGTIDYYVKNTKDLLFNALLPGNTGFASAISNLGSSQNKGVELALDGDIIRSKDFKWNLAINVARNRNKLVSLNSDFLNPVNGNISPPSGGGVLRVGEPFGMMFGRVAEGIIQDKAQLDALNARAADGIYQLAGTAPGDLWYRDLNGDGKANTLDQTVIGNALPDFSGGFTNSFTYKNFRLNALFTYSIGNDLNWTAQASAITFQSQASSENKMIMALDRWTPERPTNQPRAVYGDPNANYFGSSFFVYDASFLRLKNLNIVYALPAKLLQRTKFIKNLEINGSATNLLTFTKYPGMDPETSNASGNDINVGSDVSRFPIAKVFTVGLRAGF